jgi:hypothetical protein
MSRAVLRKRKRLSKKQLSTLDTVENGAQSGSEEEEDEFSEIPPETLNRNKRHPPDMVNAIQGTYDQFWLSTVNAQDISEDNESALSKSLLYIAEMPDDDDLSSSAKASLLLSKIIHPVRVQDFYSRHWGKKAVYSIRSDQSYFKKVMTRKTLENIFAKQLLFVEENIDFYDPNSNAPCSVYFKSKDSGTIDDEDADAADEDEDGEASDQPIDGGDSDNLDAGREKAPQETSSAEIWKEFNKGSTIKLLTPEMYHDSTWAILSALEHEFDCKVGAVAVLVPARSLANKAAATATEGSTGSKGGGNKQQHGSSSGSSSSSSSSNSPTIANTVAYENRDSFILQLEGQSRWRASPNPHPALLRPLQSGRLPLSDVAQWDKPAVDVVLRPGDSLYIPKGWVFQQDNNGSDSASASGASSSSSSSSSGGKGAKKLSPSDQQQQQQQQGQDHSLHLQVYCNEGGGNTTGSLLELALPEALAAAIQAHAELRAPLPRRLGSMLGIAASENDDDVNRQHLQHHIAQAVQLVTNSVMSILDPAADQVGT